MPKLVDLTGKRFTRLLVLSYSKSKRKWWCRCDCGKEAWVRADSLKNGGTKSCGCLQRDVVREQGKSNATHGMWGTPAYLSWYSLKQRCNNSNSTKYYNYGGRGISVCDRWANSFENFYEDMGDRPEGKTIDRIDNEGDYTPENCKWSTPLEQCQNKRQRASKTGVAGVDATSSGRFQAVSCYNHKRVHIGTYGTLSEAESAVKEVKARMILLSTMTRQERRSHTINRIIMLMAA